MDKQSAVAVTDGDSQTTIRFFEHAACYPVAKGHNHAVVAALRTPTADCKWSPTKKTRETHAYRLLRRIYDQPALIFIGLYVWRKVTVGEDWRQTVDTTRMPRKRKIKTLIHAFRSLQWDWCYRKDCWLFVSCLYCLLMICQKRAISWLPFPLPCHKVSHAATLLLR